MYFAKSNLVERYLDTVGANWKYRDTVKHDALHPSWERSNPCRPSSKPIIDDALVYALRMEAGDLAPPAIVFKTANGYVILDGRQRIWASREIGATTFSAYELIEPSEHLQRVVALGANQALNGVRPPENYRIDEAMKAMGEIGIGVKEAAIYAGLRPDSLQTHLDTIEVRNELERKGVEVNLANGTLAALKPFLNEPVALLAGYEAFAKSSITKQQAIELVREMLKQPGDGRQIAIANFYKKPEIQARIARGTTRKVTAKEAVFTKARAMKTVLKSRFDDAMPDMKDDDRKELAKLAKYIDGKMRQLCGDQYGAA